MNIWQDLVYYTSLAFNEVLTLFPIADSAKVSSVTDSIYSFTHLLYNADWLLPIPEIFSIVSLIIFFEGILFTFKLVRFVIHQISLGFLG